MGVLSTYGEVKTALSDYTGRASNATFTANLPIFVMRAHSTIMRDLRIPLLQTTADVVIDAERVAVPDDFRAVARLFIDDDYENPLTPTSVELRVKEAAQSVPGRPRVFAIEGRYFAFGPAPSATVTGKLLYWRALDFFANDAATNDVLVRYPFLYFYGAMAEAARFDKYDEDTALYEAMFRSEIQSAIDAEKRDAMSGGALQMNPNGGSSL